MVACDTERPTQLGKEQLLEGMNSEQQQAVSHPNGPLLVLAGAGSGKTRVLTRKIAYKLAQGVEPGRILSVTFTNKAAKEMKARIQQLVGETLTKDLWMGTFHSICGRILRRDIQHYETNSGRRWSQNFVIYDESDSVAAVKSAIKELDFDPKLYVPKTIRYMISDIKGRLKDAYEYASSAKDFRTERIAQIYDAYEAILSRNNALDFDDLMVLAVKLLQQKPEVLDKYHGLFHHILVDEFQDTNEAQYELIRLLTEGLPVSQRAVDSHPELFENRSLTVVGDVDQSIYSWRGANFRICLNFQKQFPTTTLVKLQKNYRSTRNILEVANKIIELNQDRLPKELHAVQGEGDPIFVYEAKDEVDEAYFVINQIKKLTDENPDIKPGDCALLYRTNVQSRALEDVLISKGIPYMMIGGLKFYERREIKDVLAYMTVLFNDADGYSLKRILNVPKRGLGKTTIERLEQFAGENNWTLYTAVQHADMVPELKPRAIKTLQQFAALIELLKAQSQTLALDELLLAILEQSGYYEFLKQEDPDDSDGRVANVEELVNVIREYMAANPEEEGLAGFLTQMALLSDIDTAEPVENKVVLMTLHAAKGLEYPAVFLVGMEEGLFPHSRSLNDKDGMEEERRLMYVGVTRAEKRLFMSFARRRMVFGETRYNTPSRFLKEAPANLLTGFYSLDAEPADDDGGKLDMRGFPLRDKQQRQQYQGKEYQRNTHTDSTEVNRLRTPAASKKPKAKTTLEFNENDRVKHDRFGNGTVEQVIASGNKRLYNIQFDTINGKKLLDPRYVLLQPVD